jgi:hypothetical protein
VAGETVGQRLERLAKDLDFPATFIKANDVIYMPVIKTTRKNLAKPVREFVDAGDSVTTTAQGSQKALEFVLEDL